MQIERKLILNVEDVMEMIRQHVKKAGLNPAHVCNYHFAGNSLIEVELETVEQQVPKS